MHASLNCLSTSCLHQKLPHDSILPQIQVLAVERGEADPLAGSATDVSIPLSGLLRICLAFEVKLKQSSTLQKGPLCGLKHSALFFAANFLCTHTMQSRLAQCPPYLWRGVAQAITFIRCPLLLPCHVSACVHCPGTNCVDLIGH